MSNKRFLGHARRLGLQRFLRAYTFYGQGARKADRGALEAIPLQLKAVADMVEALVGAAYVTLGEEAAWGLMRRIGAPRPARTRRWKEKRRTPGPPPDPCRRRGAGRAYPPNAPSAERAHACVFICRDPGEPLRAGARRRAARVPHDRSADRALLLDHPRKCASQPNPSSLSPSSAAAALREIIPPPRPAAAPPRIAQ